MMPIRFTRLIVVLGIFFSLLLPQVYCVAQSQVEADVEMTKTTMAANENNRVAAFGGTDKALSADDHQDKDGIRAFGGARNEKKLGGRKMMVNNFLKKEIMVLKEAKLNPAENSKIISGANHIVGKYDEKGGKWELTKLSSERSILPLKVNMLHYVAFSADYHSPRRHPPKNN